MKIAIGGKGGVGKTTIAAALARLYHEAGFKVLAIDADPDANLAAALGFPRPSEITPIAEMKALIEERMGVKLGSVGAYFKMNPRVDDLPEKYCITHQGIRLIVMGQVRKGGSGCACPENTFIRELLSYVLLGEKDVVIVDMEAGVEHLGRATAKAVDAFLVVVEPGMRSIETAYHVEKLARDIGVERTFVVANKITDESDKAFVGANTSGLKVAGYVSYHRSAKQWDMGASEEDPELMGEIEAVRGYLQEALQEAHPHPSA